MPAFEVTPSELQMLEKMECLDKHSSTMSAATLADNLAAFVRDAQEAWRQQRPSEARQALFGGTANLRTMFAGSNRDVALEVVQTASAIHERFRQAVCTPEDTVFLPKIPAYIVDTMEAPNPDAEVFFRKAAVERYNRRKSREHGTISITPV